MLENLFSSKVLFKILSFLFTKPDEKFTTSEIIKATSKKQANVSRELDKLSNYKIVIKKKQGLQNIFQLNTSFTYYLALSKFFEEYLKDNKRYYRANQDVDTSFLTLEMTWKGIHDPRAFADIGVDGFESICNIVKGKTINFYTTNLDNFIKASARALFNDIQLGEKLLFETRNSATEIQKTGEKYWKLFNSKNNFSDQELADILKEIYQLQAECVRWGVVIAFADINGDITNKAIEIIEERKNLKHSSHNYSSVLSEPEEKSLNEKAYIDIQNSSKNNLNKLLDKYFWLDQGYIGRGLTMEQIEKIKFQDHHENSKLNKEKLLTELKLTRSEEQVFELSRILVEAKSLRAESRQYLQVITNLIIDKFASKWEVPVRYVESMCASEVVNILNKKNKLPKNLEERWFNSIVVPNNTKKELAEYEFVTDQGEVKKFIAEQIHQETQEEIHELKGQTAFPGKVKGIVKLVFGAQHNNKVEEGDILVATATSPQYLPAMKKAKAFITNVGGITCHAAIVSRELKKPCIVGTKIATNVLKDGDLVEVDAEQGIVKILSKKQ